MSVTMRDVARKAGVSVRTVSRVVRNLGDVADDTRQCVQVVIEELGYRPNVVARSLRSGKTSLVGLIIPEITDPFFPEVVLGVESVAQERGYSVILCNTNADPQRELDYVELLADRQVDGFILCGGRLDAQQIEALAARHCVSVLTSRKPHHTAVINIPGEDGACEIASHLVGLGHWAIGYVGREADRLYGYRRALQEHGIEPDQRWVAGTHRASIETGYQATREVLERAPELTGIACYNDLVAIGALQACAELGRRVPEDIAIVGFDDIPLAVMATPKLTTMRVPRYRLGEMVMEQLLRVIEADGILEERLRVPVELVIRESCGAYRVSQLESMGE